MEVFAQASTSDAPLPCRRCPRGSVAVARLLSAATFLGPRLLYLRDTADSVRLSHRSGRSPYVALKTCTLGGRGSPNLRPMAVRRRKTAGSALIAVQFGTTSGMFTSSVNAGQ